MMYDHEGRRCGLNLWAPALNSSRMEDVAFSVYAKHTQEIEDVIAAVVEAGLRGETNLTIEVDDDLSEADLEYIKQEAFRRCGVTIS